ncbi:hypothetical protein TRFO_33674 [Tritrichomonas foetus]|uniref:Protein kinase domain-containing protein n=1 Tax=Tritrichomonas foetus TaxID=1144522 RepID=A0A1J4JQL2_9EUKA|nr:hypothetical protein TRFO_33674 [Tritrichomonas foetus]|eukprot:OHS99803.1 hypothetical protein TRFO_33674 [Tritrichomonas foetus]
MGDLKQPFHISPSKFEKVRLIGSGSIGKVYLVKEKATGRQCAIKFLKNDITDTNLINHTIETVCKLRHISILSPIGFSLPEVSKKRPMSIVSEYQPNGSLASLIKNSDIINTKSTVSPAAVKINILFGIAEGLRYLHELKLVHSQLTPGNILLNQNFEPILTDFSLFQLAPKKPKILIENLPFYAPEYDINSPTPEMDIFSYAMIAYSLLTNHFPFEELIYPDSVLSQTNEPLSANNSLKKTSDSTESLETDTKSGRFKIPEKLSKGERPPIPTFISDAWQTLLRRCWDNDPKNRPSFEEIVMLFLKGDLKDFDNNSKMTDTMTTSVKNYQSVCLAHNFSIKTLLNALEQIHKLTESNDSMKKVLETLNKNYSEMKDTVAFLQKKFDSFVKQPEAQISSRSEQVTLSLETNSHAQNNKNSNKINNLRKESPEFDGVNKNNLVEYLIGENHQESSRHTSSPKIQTPINSKENLLSDANNNNSNNHNHTNNSNNNNYTKVTRSESNENLKTTFKVPEPIIPVTNTSVGSAVTSKPNWTYSSSNQRRQSMKNPIKPFLSQIRQGNSNQNQSNGQQQLQPQQQIQFTNRRNSAIPQKVTTGSSPYPENNNNNYNDNTKTPFPEFNPELKMRNVLTQQQNTENFPSASISASRRKSDNDNLVKFNPNFNPSPQITHNLSQNIAKHISHSPSTDNPITIKISRGKHYSSNHSSEESIHKNTNISSSATNSANNSNSGVNGVNSIKSSSTNNTNGFGAHSINTPMSKSFCSLRSDVEKFNEMFNDSIKNNGLTSQSFNQQRKHVNAISKSESQASDGISASSSFNTISMNQSMPKIPLQKSFSTIMREKGYMYQYPYNFAPFDGIFSHLMREFGSSDLIEKGIVTVTGNSADRNRDTDLKELFNYEWKKCWTSTNLPNSYIQFDFGVHQILITHYTIKTYPCGPNYSHMKNWVLEGYSNGQWYEIDKREKNEDLNGKSKIATFACSHFSEYNVVRIRQIGPNHYGDNYLIITNIEFFGDFM